MSNNSNPRHGQGTLEAWLSRGSSSRRADPTPGNASSTRRGSARPGYRSGRKDPFRQGAALAAVAQETRAVLPSILDQLPHIDATKAERHFTAPCLV
ncbi:hypothetical protein NXS19_003455 [Fusarium pseudograminearum]|nr:hypothetical protein NXS19_003455 [Fusarium pseudograminearum]